MRNTSHDELYFIEMYLLGNYKINRRKSVEEDKPNVSISLRCKGTLHLELLSQAIWA